MSDERADATLEAEWPVVTAWIKAEPGKTGASPVTLGVGRDGPQVGYYSGGRCPADRSEHELWLRLDPRALAALPEVAAAAPYMAGGEEAERVLKFIGIRMAAIESGIPSFVNPCPSRQTWDLMTAAIRDYFTAVESGAPQPNAERAPQPFYGGGQYVPKDDAELAPQPEPRQDDPDNGPHRAYGLTDEDYRGMIQ